MIPTMDILKEYLGMIQEYPDVVDIHRGAVRKVRDCERMKEEGRIDVCDYIFKVYELVHYSYITIHVSRNFMGRTDTTNLTSGVQLALLSVFFNLV